MNANEYFKHARNLGAFRAEDCLALAREAAALDEAAEAKRLAPPSSECREVLHDGSNELKLSFAIKVF